MRPSDIFNGAAVKLMFVEVALDFIRKTAVEGSNWLFAGSLYAGQRADAITALIQSAPLNAHDPFAYN